MSIYLNDEQSQINSTRVASVARPTTVAEVRRHVRSASRCGGFVSIAGGRHAMGGQQFARDARHLDMTSLDRVLDLDTRLGLVTVEAGVQWPALIDELHCRQPDDPAPWTIRQKQTGVDAVTIGGSVAANIHGRGLAMKPFSDDIESLELIDADGELVHCDRRENAELFSLVVGGYGLFGVVTQVTLRLTRRRKLRRSVACVPVANAMDLLQRRRDAGCLFGDCQYSPSLSGDPEAHSGVVPTYEPVDPETPLTASPRSLSSDQWAKLYRLIRADKLRAYELYSRHYLDTDGQVYWSDTHQLAGAFTGHRAAVEASRGTEMITELYVPHAAFNDFMADARDALKAIDGDISYGTVRLIEPDEVSFLRWADRPLACVVCNLHVPNSPAGRDRAGTQFRRLIDCALEHCGRFYLTYHRWATPAQLTAAYPRFDAFIAAKHRYDPRGLFQSEWWRQYACG